MNTLILVDTDILIDAGHDTHTAVEYLTHLEQRAGLAISVITQMELLIGCRNKVEVRHTEHFLQRFQVVKLSETISDTAVGLIRQYRLSHGLAIPDALIAATAITMDQSFLSKNQNDYRFIKGLKLLPYPQPNKE